LTTLTLFTKAYNKGQLNQIEVSLKAAFEDLDVQLEVLGNPVNKWVKVEVAGEDEGVAKSYITKQIGVCPNSIDDIAAGSELKGYIQKMDNPDALTVDIGLIEPKAIIYAKIPLATVQAQLLGNQKVAPLKKIAELYALNPDLPVSIKVNQVHAAEGFIDAEFSAGQVEKLHSWRDALLDRLIILGTTADDVTLTLERTRLTRDVIGTEALGLFEHVLTCKLGTDAAGLIPRIGRYMRNARFVVFNPKKLAGFLGE
jgi:hypothetical protein